MAINWRTGRNAGEKFANLSKVGGPTVMRPLMAVAVRQAIIGNRKYPTSYLVGELKELVVEILHCRWAGIREEFQDCAYAAQMLVSQGTGLDFRLVCCREVIAKFLKRIEEWQTAFSKRGVRFSVDYLAGGSNHAKPAKVVAAFAKAGHVITEKEAAALFVSTPLVPPEVTDSRMDLLDLAGFNDVDKRAALTAFYGKRGKVRFVPPRLILEQSSYALNSIPRGS